MKFRRAMREEIMQKAPGMRSESTSEDRSRADTKILVFAEQILAEILAKIFPKNKQLMVVCRDFTMVYHRERIYFSSTPSCMKEEEEITKPPEGA